MTALHAPTPVVAIDGGGCDSGCQEGQGAVQATFRCTDPTSCSSSPLASQLSRACACSYFTPTATPTVTVTGTVTATPTPPDTPTETPTVTETPTPPCPYGGVPVGPGCWFLGAPGASCDDTCSGAGLACDPATIDYAGSGGTLDACLSVMAALGAPTPNVYGDSLCDAGCVEGQGGIGNLQGTIRCTEPTSCSTSFSINSPARRACACSP
jgi:hypothetical protein